MKFTNLIVQDGYAGIFTQAGKIRIFPVTDSIIRIVYTKQEAFSQKESLSVVNRAVASQFTVTQDEAFVTLRTPKLTLRVCKETCAFSYYDANGRLLAREPQQGGKQLAEFPLEKTVFDDNSTVKETQNVDGARAEAQGIKVFDRKAWHAVLSFEFGEKEALYGLGSHEEGLMNLRGHSQYLYQQNMKAVVPVLVSTNGYGILVDNYSLMRFHDDVYGSYLSIDVADELDYYFMAGPEFDDIIAGYRTLTGGCPMFPKSTFGYIQSKERYIDQDEIVAVAQEYRKRGIPLDMVVLDWKSWTGELWGQKSFDPQRFPNPAGMTQALHDMDVRFMISIWPIMRAGGQNHAEMKERGFLLGNGATYNAFDENARALYWKHAEQGLFRYGVDAWWCDCTEPFEADWNGEMKPQPEERVVINTEAAKKYIDPAYINAFSLLHSKGIYTGQRACTEEKRVVNLTRSSYAGQHRYATITWSGDIAASWETLQKQIPAGLNFCMTGEPYWSLDVGGFFVKRDEKFWFWNGGYDKGCEDLGYRELYVRFLQLGAFVPVFRSHGTDTPREAWRFGEPGTPFYDAIIKCIRLRYSLMPYIYSVAAMVTFNSYTMLRALAFDFRNDLMVYDIADQFMFGPSLMACPVTEPMYYTAGSRPVEQKNYTRQVYLPKGSGWYDFWSGEYLNGGNSICARAELDRIPLFVKAGTILPIGCPAQNTGESYVQKLCVYPGADACFTLYEDENDGYGYEKGQCAFVKVTWNDASRTLVLEGRNGSYPGMETGREITAVLAGGTDPMRQTGGKTFVYRGERLAVTL